MSHSRIFQYSSKPIDKDDYIGDSDFYDDNANGQSFHGEYCGDYVNEQDELDRIDDIKWLAINLFKFNIRLEGLEGEDKFVLGEGFKQAIQDFWYDAIKKRFEALDKENLARYTERWYLKYALIDPLSGGFGFLFFNNEEQTLSASDGFFEFLLRLNEGDSFYIGATLDYHC